MVLKLNHNRVKAGEAEANISLLQKQRELYSAEDYLTRLNRMKKRLEKYHDFLSKEYQLRDIKSTISEVDL